MRAAVIRGYRAPARERDDYSQEAKALGYLPFVRLSPMDVLTLREIHGRWVFDELLILLRDPKRIHRDWAIAFCHAAAKIPRDQLRNPETLYRLVTRHPAFRDRRSALREFQRVYFGKIWKKAKDPSANFATDWERRAVRADYELARALLAAKVEKRRKLKARGCIPISSKVKNDNDKSVNRAKTKRTVIVRKKS